MLVNAALRSVVTRFLEVHVTHVYNDQIDSVFADGSRNSDIWKEKIGTFKTALSLNNRQNNNVFVLSLLLLVNNGPTTLQLVLTLCDYEEHILKSLSIHQ